MSVAVADPFDLGLDPHRPMVVQKALRKGLPITTFVKFVRHSELPHAEVADLIGISDSTLARRKKEKKLGPEESDRLFRVARLFQALSRLFHGDTAAVKSWLKTPHAVFGGETPLKMARSEFGARQVETLIQQLEHGVYV
jgi:putative toxin-antitoxin system antitoxin component (TIGR02293 family)